MKGLILAGGRGTRLRPLTFTGNKHMIPIANRPMLFYGLDHMADAGITEVGVVLGPLHEGIRESIGGGQDFGLKITYINQGDPLGLAHAVSCSREFLGSDPFVMYLGDNLLQEGVRPFVDAFQAMSPDAVIGVTRVAHPERYGVLELEGERIVSVSEKPDNPRSNLALVGVYLFSSSIHPIIAGLKPSPRGELEITDAIRELNRTGRPISVRRVSGWWKDTGRPEDLLEANDLILGTIPNSGIEGTAHVATGATLAGAVRLGPGSEVDSTSRIVGPAVIGANVRVERGSSIGPRVSIGDRCVIAGSTVQRSIIMESTTIVGPIELRDSIIGRFASLLAESGTQVKLSCTLGDATQLRF